MYSQLCTEKKIEMRIPPLIGKIELPNVFGHKWLVHCKIIVLYMMYIPFQCIS